MEIECILVGSLWVQVLPRIRSSDETLPVSSCERRQHSIPTNQ
jgi:hypothetical protein